MHEVRVIVSPKTLLSFGVIRGVGAA